MSGETSLAAKGKTEEDINSLNVTVDIFFCETQFRRVNNRLITLLT